MADVFDVLIGQDAAAAMLRQHVASPVHAYLFTGPAGSSLHDALVSFAAALQCPDNGCGTCSTCRRVLQGSDTDGYFAQRSGVSWRVDELREAERVSRRRPLGPGYQVVVIEEVDLTTTGSSPSAPALLKSLEEPPSRTIFLLSAEEVPDTLNTVVSRCVQVRLRALNEADIKSILQRDGNDEALSAAAAIGANGNLHRARILVRDPQLHSRLAAWRHVPERLTGAPSVSTAIAVEIAASLDQALAPLVATQEEQLEYRLEDARELGQRGIANRKDLEAQFKREQRRFRIDEVRFGLSALVSVYRDRLHESLENVQDGHRRDEHRVETSLRAIDLILLTNDRLSSNVDETLLLNDLMLSLAEL